LIFDLAATVSVCLIVKGCCLFDVCSAAEDFFDLLSVLGEVRRLSEFLLHSLFCDVRMTTDVRLRFRSEYPLFESDLFLMGKHLRGSSAMN
jgi:hypothetical protein